MARTLLVRGMVVGIVAGLAALVFAKVFGEPYVAAAIDYEGAQAAGEIEGPELVSRGVQSTLGLGVGVIVYGVAVGGLFALAYTVAQGRIGGFGARATAALVALGGYLAVVVVPSVKYPPNPPAVGDPDTIGRRTGLYLTMVAVSVLLAVAAVYIGRRLAPSVGVWDATLLAAGAFILGIGLAQLALPTINEVKPDFPATVLWDFRVASLGTQAVLWSTLGLLFGGLTERSLRRAVVVTSPSRALPAR